MAKTVDEYVLKTSVEGQTQMADLSAKLSSIEESSKKTATAMNQVQGGVRNTAYQIQDLAVQIAGGTSAFVALGQQLPQLLSGFGTVGVVIGAVAAVAIPALQAGLKAAGIDLRSLDETTRALVESTSKLKEAQQQNLPSIQGLRTGYGDLADDVKRFNILQQQIFEKKAYSDLIAQVDNLKSSIETSTQTMAKLREQTGLLGGALTPAPVEWFYGIEGAIKRFNLGITIEQANELSKRLKNVDASKPEEAVKALEGIAKYLNDSIPAGSEFRKTFDESLKSILETNKAILEQKRNINAAAIAATEYNSAILNLQTEKGPGIASARRNFELITAARLEGELKVAEFRKKIDKEISDNESLKIVKEAEYQAFKRKTEQETLDKQKDVRKAQYETFYGIELTNDSKKRSLELENNLLTIQDNKRYFLAYEVQYEQDLAKNRKEQKDTLAGIAEQLRKNTITVDQALTLEQEAYDIRRRADDVAEKARQKRKGDAADAQQQVLFEGDARRRAVEYDIKALEIRQQMRNAYPEDIDHEVNVAKIKNDQFEAEMKINREMEMGKISRQDALERIAKTNDEMTRLLELERERTKEAQRYRTASFGEGATDAVSKIIRDNLTAYQKAGKMVEAVYANMGSAIDNFVETGKFKFGDFTRSVINDLIKIQLKADITSVLGAGLKFLGFSLPGRAAGGPVSGNSPYIVGEHGPELFIPRTAGNIVPNGSTIASSAATSITYNINAVDTNSFKQLVARDPSFIYAVTEQGRKNIPQVRR